LKDEPKQQLLLSITDQQWNSQQEGVNYDSRGQSGEVDDRKRYDPE
jgi:hypothetical protein